MRISSPLRIEQPETNHKPSQRHSTWCTAGLHWPPGSSRGPFCGAPPLLFGSAFPLFAFPSLHHSVSWSPCSFRRQLAVEHTFIMERYIISPSSLSSDRLANTTHNVGFSSSVRIDSQSLASDESWPRLAVWVERRCTSAGGGGYRGCRRRDDGCVCCVLFDARGGGGAGKRVVVLEARDVGSGASGRNGVSSTSEAKEALPSAARKKLFSRAERDYGAGATLPSAARQRLPSRASRTLPSAARQTSSEQSEQDSSERSESPVPSERVVGRARIPLSRGARTTRQSENTINERSENPRVKREHHRRQELHTLERRERTFSRACRRTHEIAFDDWSENPVL
jgi:hypothetical protein